jgi:tetratricopeptide (TPR) repeat protein
MSNPVPPSRLSFEENINTLLEELVLADKWQRPSLLLAVHKSKFGQDRAESALEGKLKKLGHNVIYITVDKERSDVPHLMVATPAASGSVFFVSNLDWGGGLDRKDAYRALNIYRELFVDNHLKAVFWLTINEASTLARFSPDFWAFRHRVIEFTGQRIPRQVKLSAGVLLWDLQNSVDPYDTLEARIAVREELLAKLPHNNEARSARIDLFNNLSYLYWAGGDSEKAAHQLMAALDLAGQQYAGKVRSSLLNGLAIIAYDARNFDRAVELLELALQDSPEDALLLINLSASRSALGRNQDALTVAKKAVKGSPRDPRIWSALGYICAATGKYDEAIAAFDKAVELAPRVAAYYLALAICYDLVERPDETARQLDLARNLAGDQTRVYLGICEAALEGNAATAFELAQAAIRSQQLSPFELRRDPNLSLLMDPRQIAEMSA